MAAPPIVNENTTNAQSLADSEAWQVLSFGPTLINAGKICTVAYNLDGGGSATMGFNGQVVNHPTDGRSTAERSVSDIVYIGY